MPAKRQHLVCAVLLAWTVALPARRARAQPLGSEARAHFDRGVTLYTDENFEAALVEFQRAFDQSRNANVRYNLAAVHEALGRFVEARDALEDYRARGTPAVVARRAAEIEARLARLRERIGTLRVAADVPGLRLTVDGAAVDPARARDGVAVSAGERRVRLEAPGFVPREERREVAGGQTLVLDAPLERERGTLAIACDVPFAAVRIDGRRVGTTPLAAPLRLAVGEYAVEIARDGYVTHRERVTVGTSGARVEAALRWDENVPARVAAAVVLEVGARFPRVTLDGRPIVADGRQPVPPGPHRLRIERDGYLPTERDVDLVPGPNTLRIWLAPTARLASEHRARAVQQRGIALGVGAAGVALVAIGTPVFAVGLGDQLAARDRRDQLDALDVACRGALATDAVCADVATAVARVCPPDAPDAARCAEAAQQRPASTALTPTLVRANAAAYVGQTGSDALVRTVVGVGLAGLGVASLVAGILLFTRAAPLDRFRRPPGYSFQIGPQSATLTVAF